MGTLIVLGLFFVANFIVLSLLLWLGGRLVRAARGTYPRALLLTFALCAANVLFLALGPMLNAVPAGDGIGTLASLATVLVVEVAVGCLLIWILFRTSLPGTLLVWLAVPASAGLA